MIDPTSEAWDTVPRWSSDRADEGAAHRPLTGARLLVLSPAAR